MIVKSQSEKETRELGRRLAKTVKNGLVCIYGELGAGKTTLVRGIARAIGIRSKIQSPTFTYQRIHRGKRALYHFDCYRLEKPDTAIINEIIQALENGDGLVAVEWPERLEKFLPKERTNVYIENIGEGKRKFRFL